MSAPRPTARPPAGAGAPAGTDLALQLAQLLPLLGQLVQQLGLARPAAGEAVAEDEPQGSAADWDRAQEGDFVTDDRLLEPDHREPEPDAAAKASQPEPPAIEEPGYDTPEEDEEVDVREELGETSYGELAEEPVADPLLEELGIESSLGESVWDESEGLELVGAEWVPD